jgi:hypothetical protein
MQKLLTVTVPVHGNEVYPAAAAVSKELECSENVGEMLKGKGKAGRLTVTPGRATDMRALLHQQPGCPTLDPLPALHVSARLAPPPTSYQPHLQSRPQRGGKRRRHARLVLIAIIGLVEAQ